MENLLLESGFCWKRTVKTPYSEDQQFQENIQKFIYYQKNKVAKRGEQKEQQGVVAWC
jgi:hypothetical protein